MKIQGISLGFRRMAYGFCYVLHNAQTIRNKNKGVFIADQDQKAFRSVSYQKERMIYHYDFIFMDQ